MNPTKTVLKKRLTALFTLVLISTLAQAQKDTLVGAEEQVVVTATRSERKMGNVAVPVLILDQKSIRKTGSVKVQDILQEQTGITIINSTLATSLSGYPNPFGQGVQMQGLDPAYTLILLDGEPLVGRNAGILKLGRLATGNIQQMEVVKGPSSCLYGSEALAGVINILTQTPAKLSAEAQVQVASNGVLGITASYGNRNKRTAIQGFFNHYQGNGYDLDPNIYGKTSDPFRDITGQIKIIHDMSPKDRLTVSLRNFNERIDNNYQIQWQGQPSVVKGHTNENDLSTFAQWLHKPNEATKWYFRGFFDRYSNTSFVNLEKTGARFDETSFNQYIIKPEVQFEKASKEHSKYVAGAGMYLEMIDANRYAGRRDLTTFYAFTQEEWYLSKKRWTIVAGARLDKRTDIAAKLSPRLAVAYQPNKKWKFTASTGFGFKTPDFRHMYLSFNNTQIGYSLIGALELADQLQKLKQQGLIDAAVNITPFTGDNSLKPETSYGSYVGAKFNVPEWQIEAGAFRNDVRNLIDRFTLPFNKTNSGNIFSYRNYARIFTQGIEVNIKTSVLKPFIISAGYQFLNTGDKDVISSIKAGNVYGRDPVTQVSYRVALNNYGGLFNRSKHSGNFKIGYTTDNGWDIFTRLMYNGRSGFNDVNGNNIPDIDAEYMPAYWLCNISVSKRISYLLQVQTGVENLFDHTNAVQQPQFAGRTYFLNLNFQLGELISKQ